MVAPTLNYLARKRDGHGCKLRALLSEAPISQDSPRSARSRSGYCAFPCRDRGVRAIKAAAQEDRDAVRTPQAHPEARSAYDCVDQGPRTNLFSLPSPRI